MDSLCLELLAPAKNREQGVAAINHGADALYIGANAFGARVAAGNSLDDLEALVRYAHLYHSKVFATVNTLLFDGELRQAEDLVIRLYNMGVDALIVQDVGLLELHLPPIELHASTQMHNRDPRRVKFLEQVGFRRVILPRETSLGEMSELRRLTSVDLEAFIHGALCVSYSGQCYLSQFLSVRSGNRGCCSQPCRSSYDLLNAQGKQLLHAAHLLSLKDFSAAQHIESMISAGITSFKIEGRLKDLSYVANVTAFYRRLLDALMEHRPLWRPASDGKTVFFFEPDPERSFNRGFTDYFLVDRQPMASLTTQKSIGKRVGKVVRSQNNIVEVDSDLSFSAGDGLCFLGSEGIMEGFLVNRAEGRRLVANKSLSLKPGTILWRNNDFAFEKLLQRNSAERKIEVSMTLSESPDGLCLLVTDNRGNSGEAELPCAKEMARDADRATDTIVRQLSKTGGSPFQVSRIDTSSLPPLFVPASLLNELRRIALHRLQEARIEAARPQDCPFTPNDVPYYESVLDYRANVVNDSAEAFYRRHGAVVAERGVEQSLDYRDKALMTTKYCIRYELGQCLQLKNNDRVDPDYRGALFLRNNGHRFRLEFDCDRCEMRLFNDSPSSKK